MEFLSTPSARRATPDPAGAVVSDQFLSTPSARRATLSFQPKKERALYFYPRPPRGGRRWVRYTPASSALIFIHALREEGDCTAQMIDPELVQFLSTPSARRATAAYLLRLAESRYFYPRPPRGGRPCCSGQAPTLHADFYPRPPRGGRLLCALDQLADQRISIHALREEGDAVFRLLWLYHSIFLSTPSARRATYPRCSPCGWSAISIHALREEGDRRNNRQSRVE